MRFIHTADWHLGKTFSFLDREQNRSLNEARFTTVEALFSYARERGIATILCAGDQFDTGELKSTDLISRLFSVIAGYPEIRVIMIAGNHDPLIPNTIYRRILTQRMLPDNLHIAGQRETIRLGSANESEEEHCVIFASSLTAKTGRENPLHWIPEEGDADEIRIALAHGSLAIPGKYQEDDFPIPRDLTRRKALDYAALGHWHSAFRENERIGYPGTPEPIQFGEKGSVLDVTIEHHGAIPAVAVVPIEPQYSWEREVVHINNTNVEHTIETMKSRHPRTIKQLKLEGILSSIAYAELKEALTIAEANFFSLRIEDAIDISPSEEEIATLDSIDHLGEVVKTLMNGRDIVPSIDEDVSADTHDIKTAALDRLYHFIRRKELL